MNHFDPYYLSFTFVNLVGDHTLSANSLKLFGIAVLSTTRTAKGMTNNSVSEFSHTVTVDKSENSG